MDREQLRALQAPLKERYRAEPGAAQLTLAASATLGELETTADADQLAALLRLTERYCVVYQSLAHGPELTISLG